MSVCPALTRVCLPCTLPLQMLDTIGVLKDELIDESTALIHALQSGRAPSAARPAVQKGPMVAEEEEEEDDDGENAPSTTRSKRKRDRSDARAAAAAAAPSVRNPLLHTTTYEEEPLQEAGPSKTKLKAKARRADRLRNDYTDALESKVCCLLYPNC